MRPGLSESHGSCQSTGRYNCKDSSNAGVYGRQGRGPVRFGLGARVLVVSVVRLGCRWTASNADLFQQLGQQLPSDPQTLPLNSVQATLSIITAGAIPTSHKQYHIYIYIYTHRPSEFEATDRDFCGIVRQAMISSLHF